MATSNEKCIQGVAALNSELNKSSGSSMDTSSTTSSSSATSSTSSSKSLSLSPVSEDNSISPLSEDNEKHTSSKNTLHSLKSQFKITLYVLFILLMGILSTSLLLYISMKEMYSPSSLALFATTLFIFIFGMVQIAYYFHVKEYQDSNDDRRILINTFVGFILMIAAYMILLMGLFVKEDSFISMMVKGIFSLLCFISMILLSVAIGATKESHSMKSVSIMVPVLLAINALMVSAPLLSKISFPSTPVLSSNMNSYSNLNRNVNVNLPERNVSHVFRSATNQLQSGSRAKNVSNAFHQATRKIRGNK